MPTPRDIADACCAALKAAKQALPPGGKITMEQIHAIIEQAATATELLSGDDKATPRRDSARDIAEQVYQAYPRKVGKEAALIAIGKALRKMNAGELTAKTAQFAEAVNSWPVSYRFTTDGRDLCPLPATWFNQGRYADDPKEWRRFGARKSAHHQHVSPPEPQGWREQFPDFLEKEKHWTALQPAQQEYIIKAMSLADGFSETPTAVQAEQHLRQA